ncbi:unnamed protein product [Acanthocheilonema viteae]|uniref:protein-serine/threonine phosphatase n=1 Tax=Acanthocheilonema viteae TaxID=6277 RepID=A0A498SDK1_ACAVI|nr:unnamed protein product [Acanthocheilonema viteae]VBB30202.1 unnamed protein product [Acanthocheilonema viteae]
MLVILSLHKCVDKSGQFIEIPLGTVRHSDGTSLKRRTKVWKFLEKFIAKLLTAPENNMNSMITLSEIHEVCLRCREVFRMEKTLLHIDPPIYILGDIHGFGENDLKNRIPPRKSYLFIVFNCMPFAALIGGSIFAAHGRILEDLHWNQFRRICRSTDVTDIGFVNDLIWADPGKLPGKYIQNPQGIS